MNFDVFSLVLKYVVMRLKNHAIYAPLSEMQKTQLQSGNMSIAKMLLLTDGTPQFKIFKDDINIQADELEFVLDFLAFFDNKRDLSRGIYYIKVSDGYIVSLKPTWQAKFLLNLYDNILLFNNAEQKEFMNVVLNAKANPSIFDAKDGITAKAFELRQGFPVIRSNQEGYYENCAIQNVSNVNIRNDIENLYIEEKRKGGMNRHKDTTAIKLQIIKPLHLNKEKIKGITTNQRAENISILLNNLYTTNDDKIRQFANEYLLDAILLLSKRVKVYFSDDNTPQIYKWCLQIEKGEI